MAKSKKPSASKSSKKSNAKKKPKRFEDLPKYDPNEPQPVWDGTLLVLEDRILHEFSHRGEEPQCILQAFQDAGWKRWIPDPFDTSGEHHSKKRLRDIVRRLNDAIGRVGILFGTGGGGVSWKRI